MLKYILKRLAGMVVLFFFISILVFILIQLPPGDFLTTRIEQMKMEGTPLQESVIQTTMQEYNLDKHIIVQYFLWMKDILLHGDFGKSFSYDMDVTDVIGSRLLMTSVLSLLTMVFVWVVAFPVGVIAALKQYSWFDYLFSCLGFIGVSIPSFMLALVGIYTIFEHTGVLLTGLFSMEFIDQPMSWAKLQDLLRHIWLPILIIGIHGTASSIRVIRGQMLDEMGKQYITAAKARGVCGAGLLFRYPIRVAVNPMVSTVGWMLPNIVSGESIVAVVLNLQTLGPVLLKALQTQDMYLAGSILLMTSILSLVGTLLSDILLAALDPRIRIGGGTAR